MLNYQKPDFSRPAVRPLTGAGKVVISLFFNLVIPRPGEPGRGVFIRVISMNKRFIVIMAGGRGERFWPLSRIVRPKHLLPIVGDKPMLVQTIDRIADLVPAENIFIITNREQREAILDLPLEVVPEQVIGEPMGRDTAAAVGLATILVKLREADAAFAILPADAVIDSAAQFREDLEACFEAAEREAALVTIGVKPSRPSTGYGYIHRGAVRFTLGDRSIYSVQRFVEKPDRPTAERYLASGEFYWNAGIFVWRVPVIEVEMMRHTPSLWGVMQKVERELSRGGELDGLLDTCYPSLDRISVDYALLEKAGNVLTIESSFEWDDVGEWPAIARHHPGDEHNNVIKGHALVRDGTGNIVVSHKGHLTALLGVDDLIVVQTPDATLVCSKSKAQEIKELVQTIAEDPDTNHLS